MQLGHQTTVTAGMKSGPSYRPDATIDCSQLTKCKHARVTKRNRGGPKNYNFKNLMKWCQKRFMTCEVNGIVCVRFVIVCSKARGRRFVLVCSLECFSCSWLLLPSQVILFLILIVELQSLTQFFLMWLLSTDISCSCISRLVVCFSSTLSVTLSL